MPAAPVSTEQQLRDAHIRIAALEKELHALRAGPPHPHPSPATPAAFSDVSRDQTHSHGSRSPSSPCSPSPQALIHPAPSSPVASTSSPSSPSPSPSSSPSTATSPSPALTPSTSPPSPSCSPSCSPSSNTPSVSPSTTPSISASPSASPSTPASPSGMAAAPEAAAAKPSAAASGAAKGNAPKRRPVPLPLSKTSAMKKDRNVLVTKCPEPRPGQTRYWTDEEHDRFLEAIAEYGEKAYVAISNFVETRTPKQVRTHAQKFQMKMARLARQCLEAGQPIHIPPGMCPVIEVPIGSKSTIVPITPEQSAKLCPPRHAGKEGVLDPTTIVSTLSSSGVPSAKRRGTAKTGKAGIDTLTARVDKPANAKSGADSDAKMHNEDDGDDEDEAAVSGKEKRRSLGGDESSSSRTDACLEYLGCTVGPKDEMELETSFAEELNETLQHGDVLDAEVAGYGDVVMSDKSSSDCGSSGEDDDLEDLEKLDDDLCLAPFTNPSETWLLPDASAAVA